MPLYLSASLISTEWRAGHLDHPDLVVVEWSFKLSDVRGEWGQPGDTLAVTGGLK